MSTRKGFEALKYALRQSRDGVVVSFVIHPNDIEPELMSLPIGSRVMVGWQEIAEHDASLPAAEEVRGILPVAASSNGKTPENVGSTPAAAAKPKRKFSELSLPEQCALRIYEDPRFERFVAETKDVGVETKEDLNVYVKQVLGIDSKRELSRNHDAANKWRQLFETPFQRWLTDQEYKDSAR